MIATGERDMIPVVRAGSQQRRTARLTIGQDHEEQVFFRPRSANSSKARRLVRTSHSWVKVLPQPMMQRDRRFRSEQLGNAVSESSDPNAVDGDYEPNCHRRPSRSKRLNCPRSHDRSLSFSLITRPSVVQGRHGKVGKILVPTLGMTV